MESGESGPSGAFHNTERSESTPKGGAENTTESGCAQSSECGETQPNEVAESIAIPLEEDAGGRGLGLDSPARSDAMHSPVSLHSDGAPAHRTRAGRWAYQSTQAIRRLQDSVKRSCHWDGDNPLRTCGDCDDSR